MEVPPFLRRLWKYGASSFLAVILDFSLLFFFVESLHWNIIPAATVAFVLGHSMNYFISRHWNFHNTDREHKVAYFLFVGFGCLSLGLTVLLLKFIVEAGVYYIYARIAVGLVVGFCNFLFNYYVTFKAHLIPEDMDRF